MTEQVPPEPDVGLRFLSRKQYLELVGPDELERQLTRLAARHRDHSMPASEPTDDTQPG